MANTNIPAKGAMSRMPRTMNFPVSAPNPPMRAATDGTRMSATSGDTRLLMIAARRTTTVSRPRNASTGRLLSRGCEAGRNLDLQAEQQKCERLAVRVQPESLVDAAVKHTLQNEVHRVKSGKDVPTH